MKIHDMKLNTMLFLSFLAVTSLYLVSCGDDPDPPVASCDDVDATYDGDVKAIINSCSNASCHGGTNMNIPENTRNFTSFIGLNAVTNSGLLVKRVITDQDMPPSGALSQAQLDLLQCWADAGYPEN